MKKGLILAAAGLILIGVSGFLLFGKLLKQPAKAALQIASAPDSEVYLDGQKAGLTPYFNDQLEVREYSVRLVPQDQNSGFASWEGKVSLVANIVTSVNYQLGTSNELASGEILALEKIADPKISSLAVVSLPEAALVKINGESKGFSPVLVDNLAPNQYQITVSAPGFAEKAISTQTIAGYKLAITVKLAQEELEGVAEATSSAASDESSEKEKEEGVKGSSSASSSATSKKHYVKILDTPTGWLRVRTKPNGTEVAKAKPDETFPYLKDTQDGWYKIEYEAGEEGWVSGVYAELIE